MGRGAGMRGRGAGPAATPCRKRRSSTSSPRSGEVAEPRPSRREHHRPWRWRWRPAAPSTAGAAAATRERGVMLCSGCRPTRDTPWPAHRKRSSSSSGSTYAPAGDAGRGQAKSGVTFMPRLTQGGTVGGRGRIAVQSVRCRSEAPGPARTSQRSSSLARGGSPSARYRRSGRCTGRPRSRHPRLPFAPPFSEQEAQRSRAPRRHPWVTGLRRRSSLAQPPVVAP